MRRSPEAQKNRPETVGTAARDRRTVPVPPALLELAERTLHEHGPTRGARVLRISPNALNGVVTTGRGMPGTVALLEQCAALAAGAA